jgi:uncharacterized membrane protein HdeD (DUF308 family)
MQADTRAEVTPLLTRDEEVSLLRLETSEEIAKNWAWIGAFGVFNVLFGCACLSYPVVASTGMELLLSYSVLLAGSFHLFAACFSYSFKMHLLALGAVQILVGILMLIHPYGVLVILTLFAALVFMSAGTVQITLARRNNEMAARGLNMFSGTLAIAMSIIIIIGMPLSSWVTIGILFGVNSINVGVTRLILSGYGLSLSRAESTGETPALPQWLA